MFSFMLCQYINIRMIDDLKGEFNSQVQLDLSVRGQAAVASVACL